MNKLSTSGFSFPMRDIKKDTIFLISQFGSLGCEPIELVADEEEIMLQRPKLVNANQLITKVALGISCLNSLKAPKAFIYKLSGAAVVGPGLICVENSIVSESIGNCSKTNNLSIFGSISRDNLFVFTGRDVASHSHESGPYLLLGQVWDGNYGHFIYETFSKLLVAKKWLESNLENCTIVLLNYPAGMREKWEGLIRLAGFTNKIIYTSGEYDYFQDAYWISPLTHHPLIVHPACIRSLKTFAAEAATKMGHQSLASNEKVYFSRNKMKTRRFLNEEELTRELRKMNFTIIEAPESLSCPEQIALMSNTSVLAGNNGGAISNMFFMGDGGHLLLFSSPLMQDDMFYVTSSVKRMMYVSVHGESQAELQTMNSDFRVPSEMIDEAVAYLSVKDD